MSDVNEKEIWKDVVGYEGLYKVSNFGNVYSWRVKRNLKPGNHNDGYKFVILYKNGDKSFKTIHRLVAEAFIPNPNNYPVINHKDEDKTNNNVNNLEWCSELYNNTYNDRHIKIAEKLSKYVYAYNDNCKMVYEFKSINEADRHLGWGRGNIWSSCVNKNRSCHGLLWSYDKLTEQEIIDRFKLIKERKIEHHQLGEFAKQKLSKPCSRYTMDWEYIDSYPSIQEAGRQLDINPSLISGVCRGEHSYTHGYRFKYAD